MCVWGVSVGYGEMVCVLAELTIQFQETIFT